MADNINEEKVIQEDQEIEYSTNTDDGADLDDSVVAEEAQTETIKKLREKLKMALAEKQEYLTNWQKDKADFVNARKRDEASNREFIKFASEGLVNDLIPVLDSFNMAFANKEAWEKVDKNWRMGVEYIANQLKNVLENSGVKEINPVGEKFDPMRDEAISFEPTEESNKDQVIVNVIQKGYSLNGKVLKAPRVIVGEFKK